MRMDPLIFEALGVPMHLMSIHIHPSHPSYSPESPAQASQAAMIMVTIVADQPPAKILNKSYYFD